MRHGQRGIGANLQRFRGENVTVLSKFRPPGTCRYSRVFTGVTAAASSRRSGAMDEREKLLSKLKRYSTIRDRISDERAVAAIEQLIRETEERLRQIEDHAPDQKALNQTSGRCAMTFYHITLRDRETQT